MSTIQEKLRKPIFTINDGLPELAKEPYDAERQEAANVIDGLVEALEDCNSLLLSLAQSEYELTKHIQGQEKKYKSIKMHWKKWWDLTRKLNKGVKS